MKFWFGQREWGWRLWGISYGDQWFIGLSIKQPLRPTQGAK